METIEQLLKDDKEEIEEICILCTKKIDRKDITKHYTDKSILSYFLSSPKNIKRWNRYFKKRKKFWFLCPHCKQISILDYHWVKKK